MKKKNPAMMDTQARVIPRLTCPSRVHHSSKIEAKIWEFRFGKFSKPKWDAVKELERSKEKHKIGKFGEQANQVGNQFQKTKIFHSKLSKTYHNLEPTLESFPKPNNWPPKPSKQLYIINKPQGLEHTIPSPPHSTHILHSLTLSSLSFSLPHSPLFLCFFKQIIL